MSTLGALRNHAHTGERRCVPCTVLNLAILWIAVNVVVLFGWESLDTNSFVLGAVVLALGLAVIWLRGYLVPYTPRFAPKLVAATPVPDEWFHETRGADGLTPESYDGDELLAALGRGGVIEADERQVYLDPEFDQRWRAEMQRLATLSLSSLGEALKELPTVPHAHATETDGGQWIAIGGRSTLVARHVAVAELGAVHALEPAVDEPERRVAMARPLREFLSDCPLCEVPFEQSTEVSCCGGHTNPREEPRQTLVCPRCEQRFLTLPPASDARDSP
jgi:hypothetical protein